MSDTIRTDIAIIGGGSGGLTLAAGAVQMGAKVVLIERDKMGGDCLNYGCVPSKSLLAAARQAEGVRAGFGITGTKPKVTFAEVNRHVKQVIASIAPHDSVERFASLGVRVIQESAHFVAKRTLQAGKYTVRARYIVIATGSSPMVPPIPGLDKCAYFTNETIFENKTLPRHLLVIGGGPIGLEMAQAHAKLGAKVSVADMGPILPRDDPELTAVIRKRLLGMGIALHEHIQIDSVKKGGARGGTQGVTLKLKGDGKDGSGNKGDTPQNLSGSHLLVAAGRRANVGDLDLDKAGIRWSPRGVEVNARLQTADKRVYAIGDVASPYQFTHVAAYHAGMVIRSILFKMPVKVNYRALPWVTYTDPEMANCGLSYADAVKQHGAGHLRVLTVPFAENDRARTERLDDEGIIKVIVTKRGKILGVAMVGRSAGELIQPWCLAIQNKLKIGAMAGYIAPYPTLGELNKKVAGSFYKKALFENPGLKIIVRCLMRLTSF